MGHMRVPVAISTADVAARGFSWSAAMYSRVEIANTNTRPVSDLLETWEKGTDPGSFFYLRSSPYHLIRTKALQNDWSLIYPKGDAITPLNPRAFVSADLSHGDILLSKDSNIGECAMVDGDGWKNHAISGGVVQLRSRINRFYLFAFFKHRLFKEELSALVPRGATIAHANELWLTCKIPFPNQPNSDQVEKYVAALMEAIFDKERAIRALHSAAISAVEAEIDEGQTKPFRFALPTRQNMLNAARMDAGYWSPPLREALHRLEHYRRGSFSSIYKAGYTTRRGPNLAVSVSGPAQYSDKPFGNALPLATPGDISDVMTLPRFRYYGNRRRVDTVRHGEMLFAGKGVREVSIGHTWVNLGDTPFVTNFDSFLISSNDQMRVAFLAVFLSYLKSIGVFARLSDTSNGGSFVQSHFSALPVPKFQDSFQEEIANYYVSSPSQGDSAHNVGLDSFVAWHAARNKTLGIWQLDAELKILKRDLSRVLDSIIGDEAVHIPSDLATSSCKATN
jgi:hypothetical protein